MAFYHIIAAIAAILGVVECAGVKGRNNLAKRQHADAHNVTSQIKLPDWNYANATTKGATADGKVGVILEDDIVEGKPGNDGATVKKGMNIVIFGPGLMVQSELGLIPFLAEPPSKAGCSVSRRPARTASSQRCN